MTALSKAFSDQALACRNLGSPFMGRLFELFSDTWPTGSALARRSEQFEGDLGPASVSLPLRIGGGLHAAKLLGDAELAAIYPPNDPDDARFRNGVLSALDRHDAFLTDWVGFAPQTNELRRSAGLIPGAYLAADMFGLPVVLSELGASGGLNLMWDQFALETENWRVGPDAPAVTLRPDWHGPAPTGQTPVIAERRGVDLNPLDPNDPEDFLRLTAYLWADQPERLEMTRAAAGAVPAPVDKGDAIDWLETRLQTAPGGHLHLVQNTVAWQYFPQDAQARGRALLAEAGARATPDAPLAWLQLETDGDLHGLGGGALSLQVWPGGDRLPLGRADFHGRWIRWGPPSAAG